METVEIDFSKLSGIYPLLEKNHECAGTLVIKGQCVEKFTMSAGESDSVQTPLSRLNWHTHPLFLYIREDVCWGWPSGEDMREVIFFSMGGNRAHLVFAAEGVYILSVTDCFRNWIRDEVDDKWDRGLIVAFLELVFKSTHNLRTVEYNKLNPLKPRDWIKMVKRLKIEYLFAKKTEGADRCGKITCSGITAYEVGEKKSEIMSISDYIKSYEGETIEIYSVEKDGTVKDIKKLPIKEALESIEKLASSLKKSCKEKTRVYNIKFVKNRGTADFIDSTPEEKKNILKECAEKITNPNVVVDL